MNPLKPFFLLISLLILMAGAGCVTKGDPTPQPTGMTLEFRVLKAAAAKRDAMVGVSTTQENLQDEIYAYQGRSDQNGLAILHYLSAATYHYRIWFTEQGVYREATGIVEISEGNDESVTIYF